MNTILALVDLDGKTSVVMDTAFRLAKKHGSNLIIYHHLHHDEYVSVEGNIFSLNNDMSLSKYGKKFETIFNVKPKYVFGRGKFKKGILSFIKDNNIDLVVMASNGISNAKEMIFGSHAEIIIENAPCSVLILKDEELDDELNEVVFASSFNEKDKEVFLYFLEFMKLPEDTLIHLLMIDTYSFFNQPSVLVKEAFKEFQILAKPYKTEPHFFHGTSVEDGIPNFMEKHQPDLLIMSNKYSRLLRSSLSNSKMIKTLHNNQYPFLNIDYVKEK